MRVAPSKWHQQSCQSKPKTATGDQVSYELVGVHICFVFLGVINFFIVGPCREGLGMWRSGVSLW